MSVFHQSTINHSLKELEHYYAELKETLEGKALDKSEYLYMNFDPDGPMTPQLVRVDVNAVLDAVGHFRASLENVRRLKSKEVKQGK